nr:3-methyl-2-oxobutanoate hydroxymethyltransferase [Saccharopolyspora sp. ASAGF58]
MMPSMKIPVIGIGAGPDTDGQVLVYHDLLGIFDGFKPKFAKRWADVRTTMIDAVGAYAAGVRRQDFPAPEHCYAIKPAELQQFIEGQDLTIPAQAPSFAEQPVGVGGHTANAQP